MQSNLPLRTLPVENSGWYLWEASNNFVFYFKKPSRIYSNT